MNRADIKVGFACNNRCTFCVQGDKRLHEPPLSTEEILRRMAEARKRNQGLVLTGGEVTIRKDFLKLVRGARALGYTDIQVQTNGRRFWDPRFCEATIAAGATEFSPALHGSTAELHNRLTRAESFAQTAKGIVNLTRLGQRVITNSVVVRDNLHALSDLVALLYRLGVRHAQLAMVHPLGTAGQDIQGVVPRLDEASAPVAAAVKRGRAMGMTVVVEAMPPCLLHDVPDAAVEEMIPFTEIFDGDVHLDDYATYRRGEGKRKSPRCTACVYDATCEGPWREYIDHYGDDDLQPILEGATS